MIQLFGIVSVPPLMADQSLLPKGELGGVLGQRLIRLKAECRVVRVSIETVALAVHLQGVYVVGADGPAAHR